MNGFARTMIELKATANANSRNIRHVLYLLSKHIRREPVDQEELEGAEEVLPQYIPCGSISELRLLDEKLRDRKFFERAVSQNVNVFLIHVTRILKCCWSECCGILNLDVTVIF